MKRLTILVTSAGFKPAGFLAHVQVIGEATPSEDDFLGLTQTYHSWVNLSDFYTYSVSDLWSEGRGGGRRGREEGEKGGGGGGEKREREEERGGKERRREEERGGRERRREEERGGRWERGGREKRGGGGRGEGREEGRERGERREGRDRVQKRSYCNMIIR